MRIGFIDQATPGWMAGATYTRSMIHALRATADSSGEIVLISKEISSFPAEHCPIDVRRVTSTSQERLAEVIAVEEIDVLFPVSDPSDQFPSVPTVAWIPDFQHVFLPEFFPSTEVQHRDAKFLSLAQQSGAVVVSSEAARRDFESILPDYAAKARAVPFASLLAYEDWWQARDPERTVRKYCLPERFLLVANQVWRHKNHHVVLDALGLLKKRGISVTVVFTGAPSDYRVHRNAHLSELLQKVASLNLRENAIFLGEVPYEEVVDLYRCSAAVVQPSMFEGWNTSLQDAKCLGKQLIASNLDVHREQAPDALFFDPSQPEELASHIEHLEDRRDKVHGETEAMDQEIAFGRQSGRRLVEILHEAIASTPALPPGRDESQAVLLADAHADLEPPPPDPVGDPHAEVVPTEATTDLDPPTPPAGITVPPTSSESVCSVPETADSPGPARGKVLACALVAVFCAGANVFTSNLGIRLATLIVSCLCGYFVADNRMRGGQARERLVRFFANVAYSLNDAILLPLRFNEVFYLKTNPHAAAAVASGAFHSAMEHYRLVGRKMHLTYSEAPGLGASLCRRLMDLIYTVHDRTLLRIRFDEESYLATHPEAARQIETKQYRNAIDHYRHAGRQQKLSYLRVDQKYRRLVNDVPVAIFLFNRPAMTAAVFAEIRKFAPTTLLLVADGARDEAEGSLCASARAMTEQIDWPCKVLRNFSPENLGCKRRVSSGLKWIFEQVEEAIILEDDCLPNPTFFAFCSHLLRRYRDDPRVMQISGSCFLTEPCTEDSYWFSRHSDIWGWATWRRAFRHYDVTMSSWPRCSSIRRRLLWKNSLERQHWERVFDKTHAGEIDTWDFQWHWAVYRKRGRVIVPRSNLITNLGHGLFATHTQEAYCPVAMLATQPIHAIKHPSCYRRQPHADFDVFTARYYFDGRLPRRKIAISALAHPTEIIVTHDLPVEAHGVGALIQKVFRGGRLWAGVYSADNHIRHKSPVPCLQINSRPDPPSRARTLVALAHALNDSPVSSVLAVPYSDQDCLNALALIEIYRVPLRLWLMDDQNIHCPGISDALLRELIEKSELRLAICEEMKIAYQEKFGRPFAVQAPVERDRDLLRHALPTTLSASPRIVSCGNVWCSDTMRSFAALTGATGLRIDWYGNLGNDLSEKDLSAAGIHLRGMVPHEQLIANLRTYDLAMVAMPDASQPGRGWQARLSFPSKIVTLSATANLPVLFLGETDSPGANFLRANDLGESCRWDLAEFSSLLERLLRLERLSEIRKNAARAAGRFSASRVAEQIWDGTAGV